MFNKILCSKTKYLLLILFLCCSSYTYADTNTKDFYSFFNEFQNSLKHAEGNIRPLCQYMQNDYIRQADIYLLMEFAQLLKQDYKYICNLSAKNKYTTSKRTGNKNAGSKAVWSIVYNDHSSIHDKYGVNSVYQLQYSLQYWDNAAGQMEKSGTNIWCVFAYIKDKWTIVNINIAG
ncbi:MAG: hypothetical protein IJK61_03915 [Bacteroidetes bacterium]|nr:hypothetical protein [Bacteroidota bacterium]